MGAVNLHSRRSARMHSPGARGGGAGVWRGCNRRDGAMLYMGDSTSRVAEPCQVQAPQQMCSGSMAAASFGSASVLIRMGRRRSSIWKTSRSPVLDETNHADPHCGQARRSLLVSGAIVLPSCKGLVEEVQRQFFPGASRQAILPPIDKDHALGVEDALDLAEKLLRLLLGGLHVGIKEEDRSRLAELEEKMIVLDKNKILIGITHLDADLLQRLLYQAQWSVWHAHGVCSRCFMVESRSGGRKDRWCRDDPNASLSPSFRQGRGRVEFPACGRAKPKPVHGEANSAHRIEGLCRLVCTAGRLGDAPR